ncbi:MAG: outer membrane lipoprotein carrier protein LolA [Bacilli bacterium]|nr:outer membrane lipoprotein carrier protein LolA [Bacilli bacterium]
MSKKILVLIAATISIFAIGCGKKNKDVITKLKNNVENLSAYHLKGELEIINNEDVYMYDIDVSYKENDLFRVSLKNINNNHIQILLKNSEGVYVLTPALNKSFKFQSDWPYNNSQIYLLQTILKDILDDGNATVKETNNGYVITSKVNYSNNEDLVKQNVYIDDSSNIKTVEVMDADDNVLMRVTFTDINTRPNFSDDYFELNSSLNTSVTDEEVQSVSKIDSIIYPMYIPEKTYLSTQDKVNTDNGERIILTFEGDNPFMLVQETSSKLSELTTIPMYGSPEMIGDTIGALSDNSITWSSNGIDYYVTSSNLSEQELLSVANSINVLPVGK